MENLFITGNNHPYLTPHCNFNAQTGECEISGESFMESAKEYYEKLIAWFRQYMEECRGDIFFTIKLSYFNSSSSRCLLDLLRLLKRYELKGHLVEIVWYIDEEEDYTIEELEDFMEYTGMKITIIPFEKK